MKTVSAIVAVSKNNAIGRNNELLWHIPQDMKHFRATTLHKTVVMGRKTFDSIGHVLPGRDNIIVTRQRGYLQIGCRVANTIQEAIDYAEYDEVVIIGGAEIYTHALPFTTKIYLTTVDDVVEDADAFFPALDMDEWETVERNNFKATEEHPSFTISTMFRKV